MKINESCNDTHLVDIILSAEDIKKIQNGLVAHVECAKDETEIFITMEG
tara:strand:- start:678 stop:824 length:147 start_codon:yes stop_codon:yes gene_type:complete